MAYISENGIVREMITEKEAKYNKPISVVTQEPTYEDRIEAVEYDNIINNKTEVNVNV